MTKVAKNPVIGKVKLVDCSVSHAVAQIEGKEIHFKIDSGELQAWMVSEDLNIFTTEPWGDPIEMPDDVLAEQDFTDLEPIDQERYLAFLYLENESTVYDSMDLTYPKEYHFTRFTFFQNCEYSTEYTTEKLEKFVIEKRFKSLFNDSLFAGLFYCDDGAVTLFSMTSLTNKGIRRADVKFSPRTKIMSIEGTGSCAITQIKINSL